MMAIGGQPDYALGSVHAVTWDGTLVIASAASHSQLATYAWGRGQCHLHGRRAEAGAHPGSRASGSTSTACRRKRPAHTLPAGSYSAVQRSESCPSRTGERDGTGRGRVGCLARDCGGDRLS